MKKLLLIGIFALGLMSFGPHSSAPSNCSEYAAEIEDVYTGGGSNQDVYDMAYNYCMDRGLFED